MSAAFVPSRTTDLADVDPTAPTNSQVLVWIASTSKWTPGSGGGNVTSVFGRSGVVVAQAGDYTAAQVTNAVSTSGSYVDPSWITSLAGPKITGALAVARIAVHQVAGDTNDLVNVKDPSNVELMSIQNGGYINFSSPTSTSFYSGTGTFFNDSPMFFRGGDAGLGQRGDFKITVGGSNQEFTLFNQDTGDVLMSCDGGANYTTGISGAIGFGCYNTGGSRVRIGGIRAADATLVLAPIGGQTGPLLDAGSKILAGGAIQPTTSADSGAPNDSLFYSSTQSALAYKDISGVVNPLYSPSLPTGRILVGAGSGVPSTDANLTWNASNKWLVTNTFTVGTFTPSPNYFIIGNSALDQTATGNYALAQDTTGLTVVNAASGQAVHLRVNNSDQMTVTSSGVNVNNALGIQAISGQASPLTTWYDSTGTALGWIRPDASLKLPSLADTAAANDSAYYSSTQSTLVYRDSSGVAWPLTALDTAPSDLYVATTGSDTTGDGSSGTPYATVSKALSRLPDVLRADHTVHVADGTYAAGIDLRRFISRGDRTLTIAGNTTTPANVVFTGTITAPDSTTCALYVAGPVRVLVQGIKTNIAATYGVFVDRNAILTLDRCTITAPNSNDIADTAVNVTNRSSVEFRGNVTLSNWALNGVGAYTYSLVTYTVAGTLTISRPDSFGAGIHLAYHAAMICQTTGTNIAISGAKVGWQLGLHGEFQHIGGSSTLSASNGSTPSSSSGILCTDLSTWSTNQPLSLTHFTTGRESNSISYIEATGGITLSSVTTASSATQNSINNP